MFLHPISEHEITNKLLEMINVKGLKINQKFSNSAQEQTLNLR